MSDSKTFSSKIAVTALAILNSCEIVWSAIFLLQQLLRLQIPHPYSWRLERFLASRISPCESFETS
jgi:hypothetical protein